jgi:alkylhydroperoxidase/carboxymuconolactone decarboxylase family protein YurZ
MTQGTNEACGCQAGTSTGYEAEKDTDFGANNDAGDAPQLMGRELSLLVAAGAAIGANSEACLNRVVSDLNDAGVPEEQIRGAVTIGQTVKDKPARRLKEAADALTGSQLMEQSIDGPCPMESMPRDETYKVTMLIAAGSAMAAGCEPCLNQAIPGLIEAGVADADIRRAVEIGQDVKDLAADNMKEVADFLAGVDLSDGYATESCRDEATLQTAGCC